MAGAAAVIYGANETLRPDELNPGRSYYSLLGDNVYIDTPNLSLLPFFDAASFTTWPNGSVTFMAWVRRLIARTLCLWDRGADLVLGA